MLVVMLMLMMTTILLLLMMLPLMMILVMMVKMMLAMLAVMVGLGTTMVEPVLMDMAGVGVGVMIRLVARVGVIVMSRVGVVDGIGVGARRQWVHRRAMGTLMLEMRFKHSNPLPSWGNASPSFFLQCGNAKKCMR